LWPPRLMAAIFCFGSSVILGLISAKLFDKRYFWPTVFVFTPILAFPPHTPFAANTEVFMLAPLLAFFYIFVLGKRSACYFFAAGVFAALALLFKPICLPIIILVSLVWLVDIWREGRGVRRVLLFLFFYGLGGVVATLAVCFPFIVTRTFGDLFEQAFIYNLLYAKSWNQFGISAFFFRMSKILTYHAAFVLLTIVYFISLPKRRPFLLPALIFAGIVSVYKTTIGHYYILLAPFWALMIAHALVKLSESQTLVRNRITIELLVFLSVVLSILPLAAQFSKTPVELSEWIYGTANPFTESQIIAREIVKITGPRDKVFIAGSEPQILFYSKRVSPTKYMVTHALNIETKKREEYQREVVEELKSTPPKAIVYCQLAYSNLWNESSPSIFIDYLNSEIEKHYEMAGVTVRIRGKLYWLSEPEEEEIRSASLILYRMKS
jgi:hypothetical protein